MFTRNQLLAPAAVSLALVTALSGCGGGNDKACDQLKAAMTDMQKSVTSSSDLDAMTKQLAETAKQVRTIADGASGDVKTAANTLADSMDSLGSGSATDLPDTTKLEQAATTLDKECGS